MKLIFKNHFFCITFSWNLQKLIYSPSIYVQGSIWGYEKIKSTRNQSKRNYSRSLKMTKITTVTVTTIITVTYSRIDPTNNKQDQSVFWPKFLKFCWRSLLNNGN